MHKIKAAFFDRDGTLINDVSYLSRLDDVILIPQAIKLARFLQKNNYILFVVTNQSGIARGLFSEKFVHETHNHLQNLLTDHGIAIKQFYFCPHHPTEAVLQEYSSICTCRKPQPGMLINAAREHNIDLSSSLMFGDKALDIDAGRAAGCASFDIISLIEQSEDKWESLLFK